MSASGSRISISRLGARQHPRRRLVCLPFAGGGVGAFRWWPKWLPDDVELMAVQLPGRESMVRECPFDTVAECVDAIMPVLVSASDLPYAIFGHSMGALVAFELTLALQEAGAALPAHLFLSARRPPDVPDPDPPVHELPDAEFLDELQRRYGAVPEAVRQEADLLALLLPTLRADIRIIERYTRQGTGKVGCPVHVYGGSRDLHPRPDQLQGWERVVEGPLRLRVFDGDHFYLLSAVVPLLTEIVTAWPGQPARVEGT